MIGPGCNGHVRIVRDQAGWAADLRHHFIARINAERAVNTFQLRSIADIDPDRADLYALIAINTVAALIPALRFPLRAARLAAIIAIRDIERVLIGQRALNKLALL